MGKKTVIELESEDGKATCPFMFRVEGQNWRCQVRYYFATTNPTRDACTERSCPLRDGGEVIVKIKRKE